MVIEAGAIKLVRLSRNELDAQDNVWEPFSAPKIYPFLDFDVIDLPTDTILEPRLMTVHIEVTHGHTTVTRKNYTLFDFFGDVGALKGSLIDICSLFLSFLKLEAVLQSVLLNGVFSQKTEDGRKKPSSFSYLNWLFDGFFLCCFCRTRRRQKLRELGISRVDKHLDAVHYLKSSIFTRAALR